MLLKYFDLRQHMDAPPVGFLTLVSGKHGSGKTTLLNALAATLRSQARAYTSFLSASELASLRQEALKERLHGWLEAGARNQPALLLIDDLDALAPHEQQEVRRLTTHHTYNEITTPYIMHHHSMTRCPRSTAGQRVSAAQ